MPRMSYPGNAPVPQTSDYESGIAWAASLGHVHREYLLHHSPNEIAQRIKGLHATRDEDYELDACLFLSTTAQWICEFPSIYGTDGSRRYLVSSLPSVLLEMVNDRELYEGEACMDECRVVRRISPSLYLFITFHAFSTFLGLHFSSAGMLSWADGSISRKHGQS